VHLYDVRYVVLVVALLSIFSPIIIGSTKDLDLLVLQLVVAVFNDSGLFLSFIIVYSFHDVPYSFPSAFLLIPVIYP
jgi:hypothetical protein